MSVFFNGQLLVTPTVASVVDDSAMISRNLSTGNVLALIGRSVGGEPTKAVALRSPSHAATVLKGGELLTAAQRAFAPSSETRGPARVVAVRVNPASQAALTLVDAGAANVISLLSTDYGLYTNQIKIKIETGTSAGKKVTTQFGNGFYVKDDVARAALTVQYTGSEASATIDVTATQVVLDAPDATPVATIDLNVYDTVQKLVDRINSETDWSASVVAGSANTPSLRGLDGVTAADAKTAALTLRADLQAVVDWINGVGEGFITATRVSTALLPPANIDWTYLSGGSDGNVTNQDWQDCFTALQSEDVQWVVPLSSDAAIAAMVDAHCQFMSGPGKAERRAFVGGALGATQENATAAAALINSDRTSYVYPGYYDFDVDGELTLYPPYMLAALLGGAFSGLNPGKSMTNKSLRISGMETEIAAPTDTDALISSRVLAVRKASRGGFRVVKAISTWLNDSKFNRVEVSTGAATDFVLRSVRAALEDFVGEKASPETLFQARSRTETVLRQLSVPEPAGPGVLVGNTESPPYRNITAEIDQDVLRVEFECSPALPLNFVLITVHIRPFSSVATV